jgi:hypothetical protein
MRAGIVVNVTRADRHRLEAIVSDRSAPQKHVWRANILWQARFMWRRGSKGLTRDKTRKPGKQPLSTGTVQRVVDLVLGPPVWTADPKRVLAAVNRGKQTLESIH